MGKHRPPSKIKIKIPFGLLLIKFLPQTTSYKENKQEPGTRKIISEIRCSDFITSMQYFSPPLQSQSERKMKLIVNNNH